MDPSLYFRFYDLSIREQEIIYTILKKIFYVVEEKLSFDDVEIQLPNCLSITDYSTTFIEIIFPVKFDNNLFQIIPIEHWNSIKNIIKEVKHRRGKKPVISVFKFKGITNKRNFDIVFYLMNDSINSFNIAMEKVEYLVDILPIQLISLPSNTFEVIYFYDESSFKWLPYQAKSIENNFVNVYTFKNGLWER